MRKRRFAYSDFEAVDDSAPIHALDRRCFFGGSSNAKTSTTQTSTVQNQQVGASEGAIAAGAGATINLEQVSDDVLIAAAGEIGDVSKEAIQMAGDTARVGADTSKFALGESLGFAQEFTANQITSSRAEKKDQLDFLNRQSELIASQAGVTAPANVTEQQKLMLIGMGILAVAGVVIVLVNRGK